MAVEKIFLVGFMGCGKSTFGRYLANQIGWDFVDLDDYIEEKEKKSIKEIFSFKGEDYFRNLETSVLMESKVWKKTVVSCGGGTPCYNDNARLINDLGLSVYLRLSPEVLKDRLVNERSKRPLISDMSNTELLEFITSKLEERSRFYECANMLFEYSKEKESEFIYKLTQSIV